ncbi:DUF952 domain-containing protein [Allokutzneria sp. A3M-2-11 16]|uniref:DUF952 domain-containing protein n=1 Tax=Allokutzneria sp. A3M-2-11 16 TaxID=2962043 RepID=UPI0020B7232D|nr:DUF952 domain-containing protein [Allokutzneria sp. A3M-2-11 16]MCP3804142.1 DUF952 domain-containing protein [Allokutzneria sp. A3M-2-11 16]
MILHFCPRSEWDAALSCGVYRHPSLDEVGFIHFSDPGTVHLPANALFPGRTDLVLLEIDPSTVDVPLRWEPGHGDAPGGPWFPHLYGELPVSLVVGVHDFPPNADGTFTLPPALARRP